MRNPLLLAATSCLALGIGNAFAADATAPTTAPAPAVTAPAVTAPAAAGTLGATALVGLDVKNATGETIGEIKDVVLDGEGRATKIMFGTGGVLGLGERVVPLDWNQVTVSRDPDGRVRGSTALAKEELAMLPEYKKEKGAWRPN